MECVPQVRHLIGGNPGPIWPRQHRFSGMTAIAMVYTSSGFVVAADGRSRSTTLDENNEQIIASETEQKIYEGRYGAVPIAWAASGNVLNEDRSFNLFDAAGIAFSAANKSFHQDFHAWFRFVAFHIRKTVTEAIDSGTLPALRDNEAFAEDSDERLTFARLFVAGFVIEGSPAFAMVRLHHRNGVLREPHINVQTPEYLFSGSEIAVYYKKSDPRFAPYFHPLGPSLSDGLAHATGYIRACCDPLARKLDPLCKGIGGHIHAASVTTEGFRWFPGYEPVLAEP